MSYTYTYPRPAVTADAVIFLKIQGEIKILLIRRASPPFEGMWALPGGFLDVDESLEQCVARETKEETGLEGLRFSQIAAFSVPDRDPRHRTVTVAFLAMANEKHQPKPGSDARQVGWFSIEKLPPLAFDHDNIIKTALNKIEQQKL